MPKIWDGSKFIDVGRKTWDGTKWVGGSGNSPAPATQTISTLNTIWTADSGLNRTGDDINSWTSDTGLVLTVSEPAARPYLDYGRFGTLNGVNFNGSSARSFYISQADLDPDTTALELPQPYTMFVVLKQTAATRNSKITDGLDSAGRGLLAYNDTGKMQIHAGTSQYWGAAEVGIGKVVAAEFNGANSKVYRDNNQMPVLAANPGNQPLRGLRIGNSLSNSENFEGLVAAVRIKAGIDADYRVAESARLVSKWLG